MSQRASCSSAHSTPSATTRSLKCDPEESSVRSKSVAGFFANVRDRARGAHRGHFYATRTEVTAMTKKRPVVLALALCFTACRSNTDAAVKLSGEAPAPPSAENKLAQAPP